MPHPEDIVTVKLETAHLDDAYLGRDIHYGIRLGERIVHCKTKFDYRQFVNTTEDLLATIQTAGMDEASTLDFARMLSHEHALRGQNIDPDSDEEVARWRKENPLYREASDHVRSKLSADTMERHLGVQRGEREAGSAEIHTLLGLLQRIQDGDGLVS